MDATSALTRPTPRALGQEHPLVAAQSAPAAERPRARHAAGSPTREPPPLPRLAAARRAQAALPPARPRTPRCLAGGDPAGRQHTSTTAGSTLAPPHLGTSHHCWIACEPRLRYRTCASGWSPSRVRGPAPRTGPTSRGRDRRPSEWVCADHAPAQTRPAHDRVIVARVVADDLDARRLARLVCIGGKELSHHRHRR